MSKNTCIKKSTIVKEKTITRRNFIKAIGLGAAALALPGRGTITQGATGKIGRYKPNIILFLTDDQGWTDTSVQMMAGRPDSKSDFYQMPNFERLARKGMIFSDAYSPAPVCVPTRCSIQFGKTPARLRNTCHVSSASNCLDEVSIARVIKAANPAYATAHFGKWGLSYTPTSLPEMGYDKSDGRTNNYHGDWRSLNDKRALPADDPKRIFSLTRCANEFMQEQVKAGRPFYLQISHYAVHSQHRALKETIEKYKKLPRGKKCTLEDYQSPPPPLNRWIIEYAAMIENLDTSLGMLLKKLEELGITGNTYIIFTSDNGGDFRGNEPLRGGKGTVWEGGIRVPMVAYGPGIEAGCRCDVPVVDWDFMPTFVDLVGGSKKVLPKNIDGGSLRPLFENAGKGNVQRNTEELVFHFPASYSSTPHSAIRLGDYKLVKNWITQNYQLFNLAEDISESRDLADSMPRKARQLHKRLMAYLKEVNAEDLEYILRNDIQKMKEQQAAAQAKLRETVCSQSPDARDQWGNYHRQISSLAQKKEVFENRLRIMLKKKKE